MFISRRKFNFTNHCVTRLWRIFTNNYKIVFGNIDKQGIVSKLKVLYGIDDNLCQKNWTPIILDGLRSKLVAMR